MRHLIAPLSVIALCACPAKKSADHDDGTKPPAPPVAAPADAPGGPQIDKAQLAAFAPLPEGWAKDGQTQAQEDLGRMLYYEARLSKNHDISCNSCHQLDKYGVDGEPTSPGHKKQRGDRNSPTSYNAAGHLAQFWDGRAPDVEAQALGPIENPVEMAFDKAGAIKVLTSMPGYVEAFKKAFPDDNKPVRWENIGKAIGAFERKLVTPGPWDRYLKGDEGALNAEQKKGLALFLDTGCQGCHMGATMGGTMYRKLGERKPWPKEDDLGRFKVTQNEAEKLFFKVPSLRNIAKTGPYFHDGSVKTLPEAVKLMSEHQLGKTLKDDEVASIVTFLDALTGEIPSAYVKAPPLPPSTASTPKPDPS